MSEVSWREWGDEVFIAARESDRPVLLFLKASWCRFCKDIDQTVFHDPVYVEQIEQKYIPLLVDKDRRPDVNQRYNLGGWPTVAFLTPDGDLITGGSSLTADDVRSLIERVADYYNDHREQIHIEVENIVRQQETVDRERQMRQGQLSEEIIARVSGAILEGSDERFGGFGEGQKFPHPEAIDFAILHYAKTRDPAFQTLVVKTLTAMAEGRLHDHVAGGFFRYCGTRDWRQPQTEKLLETQAGLLRNYLEAYQLFDRPDFKKVAEGILAYLDDELWDEETGGYFGSQDADDVYYGLERRDRRDRKAPRVEPTCYTHSVAMTVSSLFKAASVLGEERWKKRAMGALHFLLERCYSQTRGMYHYYDDKCHILGLLTDQIYTARALLHAIQYTGDNDYLAIVDDLIQTIVKKQAAVHGGFYDISEDDARFGSMRRRHTSLLDNGVMAEVLLRTHCMTGDPALAEMAEKTLKAFTADYPLYGYFTAGYARAVELFLRPPLKVIVVGNRSDETTAKMLTRAQDTYISSKVILSIDPESETELLKLHAFPATVGPVAYLCLERSCVAEITDPEQIPAAMVKAEEKRSGR